MANIGIAQTSITGKSASGGGGSGTVTSVALGADSGAILTVSGSPVTTSGTLQLQFSNENANAFLCGPISGAATTPTFRGIDPKDLFIPLGSPAFIWFREDFAVAPASITVGSTTVTAVTNFEQPWASLSIVASATIANVAATAFANPGQLLLTTGSTSGNGGILFRDYQNGNNYTVLGNLSANAGWEWNCVVKLGQTTTCCLRVGVITGTNAATMTADAPANWMGVEYDTANTGNTDTDFTWVTRSAGTPTYSTTNAIAADTSFHHFRMRSTTAGTILFSVDGGTEASVNTNVPTTNMTNPFVSVLTRTASTKTATIDFVSYVAATGR